MAYYDWQGNKGKWSGTFSPALRKIQKQVHPDLNIEDGAVDLLDELLYCLMAHLSAQHGNLPESVEQCEAAVINIFPGDLVEWATGEANAAIQAYKDANRKKNSIATEFPVEKIHSRLTKEVAHSKAKFDFVCALYLVTVLDYVSADTLKLAGNYTENCNNVIITESDVKVAMNADAVLKELFEPLSEPPATVVVSPDMMKYGEVVREMLAAEKAYFKTLETIVKVFYETFDSAEIVSDQTLADIFGDIKDIHSMTENLRGNLEDAMEGKRDQYPIGECFFECAVEGYSFLLYEDYAGNLSHALECLEQLIANAEVMAFFRSIAVPFAAAVQFELSKLLVEPIYHMNHYFELLDLLIKTTPEAEEMERYHLREAAAAMRAIAPAVSTKRLPFIVKKPMYLRFVQAAAKAQLLSIQKRIEGWEGPDISATSTELIQEGRVDMWNKRKTERYVFVFDGLVVCCKQNSTVKESPLRLKELLPTKTLSVHEEPDTGDYSNGIRLDSPHGQLVFFFADAKARERWYAVLSRAATQRYLEQLRKERAVEFEAKLPELKPDPSVYPFAAPDTAEHIVFEPNPKPGAPPFVKAATLDKLVERLTYPQYADTNYLRQLLTTYRSFCSKEELLEKLIARYEIPKPTFTDKNMLRRFYKSYATPIRLRVVNVLKHWVERHYYDFHSSTKLLRRLLQFIKDSLAQDSTMKKAVSALTKSIRKRRSAEESQEQEIVFMKDDPPPLMWFPGGLPQLFHVLTLHPAELARQLTLIESELFRAVRPSELVGQAWSKANKETDAPNVLALVRRFNRVSNFVVRTIVELEHFQERVDVIVFFLEVLVELRSINNFNGVMELVSALHSSTISRLKLTWAEVPTKRKKVLEESAAIMTRENNFSAFRQELSRINPPCIPFFGMYLSDITFIEDGSADFLPSAKEGSEPLINFGKRRLVAKTIGEIQQYQNQPYSLNVEPTIRRYLEILPSHSGSPIELPDGTATAAEKEAFESAVYKQSLKIEPRDVQDKADLPKVPVVVSDPKAAKARRDYLNSKISRARLGSQASRSGRRDSTTSTVSTTSSFSFAGDRTSSVGSQVRAAVDAIRDRRPSAASTGRPRGSVSAATATPPARPTKRLSVGKRPAPPPPGAEGAVPPRPPKKG